MVFYFCFSIRVSSKTKIKYSPIGILKDLIEKTKIKYRPVGTLSTLIEKQK
jgi:hypothetical protein